MRRRATKREQRRPPSTRRLSNQARGTKRTPDRAQRCRCARAPAPQPPIISALALARQGKCMLPDGRTSLTADPARSTPQRPKPAARAWARRCVARMEHPTPRNPQRPKPAARAWARRLHPAWRTPPREARSAQSPQRGRGRVGMWCVTLFPEQFCESLS